MLPSAAMIKPEFTYGLKSLPENADTEAVPFRIYLLRGKFFRRSFPAVR
jgi:hypothetical protein